MTPALALVASAVLGANASGATVPNTGTAEFARAIPGARAPALGGGIAAIDADASAVQSNPAGLARLTSPMTGALDAGWPGSAEFIFYAGAAGWVTPTMAVGVTALYRNQGQIEFRRANSLEPDSVGEAVFTAITGAAAARILPPVELGVSFRYLQATVSDPGGAGTVLDGNGISADLGATYHPWQRVTVAAVALDVLPTGVDWSTHGRGDLFKPTYRLGGAVDLNPVLLVVQEDNLTGPFRRLREGVEWDVVPRFTVRAGLDDLRPATGFGFNQAYNRQIDLRLDYAFATGPLGGAGFAHRLTVTINWHAPNWPLGQLVFPSEEPQPRTTDPPPGPRPAPLFSWPGS